MQLYMPLIISGNGCCCSTNIVGKGLNEYIFTKDIIKGRGLVTRDRLISCRNKYKFNVLSKYLTLLKPIASKYNISEHILDTFIDLPDLEVDILNLKKLAELLNIDIDMNQDIGDVWQEQLSICEQYVNIILTKLIDMIQ